MKIAIIGVDGLKLDDFEKKKAIQEIIKIISSYEKPIIISGACPKGGIDIIAEMIADENGLEKMIFPPKTNDWDGYKERNMIISQECDVLYCITVPKKEKFCYHCKSDTHNVSGACWAKKYAETLGKETHVIVL